jgi:hypothetical protein
VTRDSVYEPRPDVPCTADMQHLADPWSFILSSSMQDRLASYYTHAARFDGMLYILVGFLGLSVRHQAIAPLLTIVPG